MGTILLAGVGDKKRASHSPAPGFAVDTIPDKCCSRSYRNLSGPREKLLGCKAISDVMPIVGPNSGVYRWKVSREKRVHGVHLLQTLLKNTLISCYTLN